MATPNTSAALLARLHPMQARTYCAADGTIETRKRVYDRRANGTIIDFENQVGRWETIRIPLAEAAKRADANRAAKARTAESMKRDEALIVASLTRDIAKIQGEISSLREAVSMHSTDANTVKCLETCIAEREGWIADREGRLASR